MVSPVAQLTTRLAYGATQLSRVAWYVGHGEIMRHPYQVGLAESVARLLGHAPGSCPSCATPPLSRDTQLLLAIISAQEVGPVARIGRLLALMWSAARR